MAVDIKTLEHHHNSLQIQFNLLLVVLSKQSPEIIGEWLAELRHVLDSEPLIPGRQRELMEAQYMRLSGNLDMLTKPPAH